MLTLRPLTVSLALGLAVLAFAAPEAAAAEKARTAAGWSILQEPGFDAAIGEGLDALYGFDFATAGRRFTAIAERYPNHPVAPLVRVLPVWWRILLDPLDTRWDAAMSRGIEESLELAEARLDRNRRDQDGRFFKAVALALRGRLRSFRHEWIPAAYDGKRAMGLVRELAEEQPGNLDLLFGLGMYDYFAATVPERYPIFKPLAGLFPKGDRERGLERLGRVSRHGRFARTEASYFLLMIYHFFERDYASTVGHLAALRGRYPDNALFHAYEGRIHAQVGQCELAEPVLASVLERWRAKRNGYTDHQAEQAFYGRVRCAMRDHRWSDAGAALDRLEGLADRRGSDYRVLSRLRRGMIQDAQGRRAAAVAAYRAALDLPDAADAHEVARRYLREPYAPPPRPEQLERLAVTGQ